MTDTLKLWDKQPGETTKAFQAFMVYREMEPYGENQRTLAKVSEVIGHKSDRGVRGWSAKYNWVMRAAALDEHRGKKIMAVKEATTEEFVKALTQRRSLQLLVLDKIVEKKLQKLDERLAQDETVKSIEIANLTTAIEKIDNLARRLAGLPTNFTSTRAKEEPDEEQVFIMGAD